MVALTPADAEIVWAYHGPGDSPDAHQTLQNIANETVAIKTELDAVKAAVAAVSNIKLTDAQVQALAAQLVPVIVPQLVAALGHALDGTK